ALAAEHRRPTRERPHVAGALVGEPHRSPFASWWARSRLALSARACSRCVDVLRSVDRASALITCPWPWAGVAASAEPASAPPARAVAAKREAVSLRIVDLLWSFTRPRFAQSGTSRGEDFAKNSCNAARGRWS